MAGALFGVGLVTAVLSMAGAPSATATAADGACVEANGVTVVVDFTELGGSVETGCAPSDAPTGRAALLAAGFAVTNTTQGLICAIDAQPDPCPVTFNGSFWSYWHSAKDSEWTSYQVGSDASHPVPGELEGWRYNDGATGPSIAPSGVTAVAQPAAADNSPARTVDTAETASSGPLFIVVGTASVAILAILLLVARSRRRQSAAGD